MTPAEILAGVVARTARRDVTDITVELDAVLKDITARYDFLKSYKSYTLTPGTAEYDISATIGISLIKEIIEIRDADGDEIEKDENLHQHLDNLESSSSGTPDSWLMYQKQSPTTSLMSDVLLLYPTPDAAEAITIYYSFYHPYPSSLIILPDTLRECVIEGVCYKVYEGKGQAGAGEPHRVEYEKKLAYAIGAVPKDLHKVKYRDI
jgi:hypothetical protein